MNLNALTCPSQQQLAAFVAGRLNVTNSTEIEQHLADCQSCCQLLKMLPDEDTLVSLLRDPEVETANEGVQRPLSPQHAATMPPTGEQLTLPPSDGVTAIADAADNEAASSLPEPLRDHSRYRIMAILGRGGMGDVYKAHHRMMNRPVALKVINARLVNSHAAVQRFHREVQAAARLTHPNIVTAFDAEQAGDTHYLVMEFVDGVELADVIKDRGPLPVAEACDYVRQAALGLQHAHEQGMVHRDIKPQNLMLTSAGVVKILDFGLANLAGAAAEEVTQQESGSPPGGPLDGRLTQLGSMMGTPDYMAPEQADDAHSADIRADIYSLGCTLYCLLAGEAPFSAGSAADKLQAHSQQAARPLSEIRDDVPAELEAVIARMMNKSPDERYRVPLDVAKALEPFVGKPAVGGHAVSKPVLQSHRSIVVPLAIVVTLLLGFFIALTGVIVVMTDQGRMVIQSEVGDVQVVVKQNGEEITTIDSKTGTQVKWLSTGKYEVELVGDDNDVKLDQTGFRMTRLGTVIVTARWNGEGSGVIRSFTTDDPTISQDNVEVADGGWKITANGPQTERLFEVPMPPMNAGPFFYRAKLKTENVKGRAYLEMWVRFPGQGEFFSKGFHLALSGTNGWAEYEIPFLLEKGQQPDLVKLNLAIEGGGTVWIKDAELRGRPQMSAAAALDDVDEPVAGRTDYDRLQGAWTCVDGVMGNKPLTKEQLATVSMKFEHDQVEVAGLGSQTFKLSYALRQFSEPKWIEFINPDRTADELSIAGIYAFDGDTLHIAFDDADRPRPRDFTPTDQHDHFVGTFRRATASQPKQTPSRSSTGILTSPPSVPSGGLPVGTNLIVDPSLEITPTGELPNGWFAWLDDGPDFKCEVVEGGVTGKHCLQISGTGTRGVVFATSIPLDRTKRYALKGRVKVEGEAGTWAVVKLNYFNSSGWLGVDDRVGVTTSDLDWKLFEKTDAIDKYPTATLIVPTGHIEGNGTARFDDLEVIAYDRDKLPANFDATHGKNNRMK